jgi:hypothetical protein
MTKLSGIGFLLREEKKVDFLNYQVYLYIYSIMTSYIYNTSSFSLIRIFGFLLE